VYKIIPLLIVQVLLLTILFVRNDSDGFNNIIGCSGLFSVLMFDHINLRESVTSSDIMYHIWTDGNSHNREVLLILPLLSSSLFLGFILGSVDYCFSICEGLISNSPPNDIDSYWKAHGLLYPEILILMLFKNLIMELINDY
jgi:hypothetical protein